MATTYKVEGMTCGGCAQSLTKRLASVAPDLQVFVSHERGELTVEDDAHDPAVIAEAVEEAGFDFEGAVPRG